MLASTVITFRICNNIDGVRIKFLIYLFVNLGFDSSKLIKTVTNCINRHNFSEKFKTIGHIFFLYLFKFLQMLVCDCK